MESNSLPNLLGLIKRFHNCSILLSLIIVVYSCNSSKERHYQMVEGFAQGTTYSIIYYDSLNRDLTSSFDSLFSIIDNSMSVYNDSSIISKFNTNQISQIDSHLAEVIIIADSIYRETDGTFDITVGPVIKSLGFWKDKATGIDSSLLKSLFPLIGMDKIRLDGLSLTKSNPKIQIDVNAIAQGYTVDVFGHFLLTKGIRNYMVEVGGEITANGLNSKGTPWVVGLDKPIEGAMPGENIQSKIYLTNRKGLATSGNYRKFIEINGQKYSHTVNPKTGFPILNSLLSATVIANSGARADALATAFMVNGLNWSINYIQAHNGIDAYLIYSDESGGYKVWISKNLKKSIKE